MPLNRKIAKKKSKVQFKVLRKSLSITLQKLDKKSNITSLSEERYSLCNRALMKQFNVATNEQPIGLKQIWVDMFRKSATYHDWNNFHRTLRLASQNHKFCGLDIVLRNTIFGYLTRSVFKDPSMLRLLLYTIAPCRNEDDIEFCIQTMLQAFNGNIEK